METEVDSQELQLAKPAVPSTQREQRSYNGTNGPTGGMAMLVSDHFGASAGTNTSADVQLILQKAAALAMNLNHKELHLAHLMHVLTLVPSAREWLTRTDVQLDPAKVREATWREFATIDFQITTPDRIGDSKEVEQIARYTLELVRFEQDPSHRSIHVKDLVKAIVAGPLRDVVRQRYSGDSTVPSLEEARSNTRHIKSLLDEMLPRQQSRIVELHSAVLGGAPTFGNFGADASRQDNGPSVGLAQDVADAKEALATSRQEMHDGVVASTSAFAELSRDLKDGHRRLEKKIRYIKHLLLTLMGSSVVLGATFAVLAAIYLKSP